MAERCPHLKLAKGLCNRCEDDFCGRLAVLVGLGWVVLAWLLI